MGGYSISLLYDQIDYDPLSLPFQDIGEEVIACAGDDDDSGEVDDFNLADGFRIHPRWSTDG